MPTMTRYRRRWAALAVLLVAEAMNLLDATIVQVAGPAIHVDLPGPAVDIPWFSAAYTLPFAVFLITGGRLGDIFGRARVFRIGVTGFVLASLVCALSGTAGLLIGARAVQGAAAALIIPQTIGLIRALFDGDELAKALGSIGPVMGLSAVTGPLLGGLLTQAVSWRAVFLVNVPLGLAVLFAARLLQEDRAAVRPRLDLAGTVLVVAGAGLLVYPLIDPAGTNRWLLAAGAALLVVFGFQQRGAAAPLVEPSLFAHRGFPAALAGSLLFFAVMTGLMQVVPMQLQLGLGVDVRTAGLTLLPLSAGLAVSSWFAGARLVPKFGARVMFAGLALLPAGILAAVAGYAFGGRGYPWPLLGALALCGLGMGTFTVPFFTAALHRVRPHETGSAAGLLNAVQQLGGTLGVALLGGLYLGTGTATAALGVGAGLAVAAAVAVIPLSSGSTRPGE
ncbi:MFS transporter [Amycolatopsis sp. NPDC051045]|uniref:MFS transporter n=1 Tax=Amycolatopsis sp. NPDC051045 TaxID=3156922 RepID=UPI003419FF5A